MKESVRAQLREYGGVLSRAVLPPGYRQWNDAKQYVIPQYVRDRDQDKQAQIDKLHQLYPHHNYVSALQRKYALMNRHGYHRPLAGADVGSTMGSYHDVYKYVIFIDLFKSFMEEYQSPVTYINLFGNALRYDISASHTRGMGIDSAYYMSKHLSAMAAQDLAYRRDTIFTQLMKQCRYVNGMDTYTAEHNRAVYAYNTALTYDNTECSERTGINRYQQLPLLDHHFRYFPGYLPIVRSMLRSHDRVIVMEPNQQYHQQLKQFVGNDRRFSIQHLNPFYRGAHTDNEHTDLVRAVQDPAQPDITLSSIPQFIDEKSGEKVAYRDLPTPSHTLPPQHVIDEIVEQLKELHLHDVFNVPSDDPVRATDLQYFLDQLQTNDVSHLGDSDRLLSEWLYEKQGDINAAIDAVEEIETSEMDEDDDDQIQDDNSPPSHALNGDQHDANAVAADDTVPNQVEMQSALDDVDDDEYYSAAETLTLLHQRRAQLTAFIDAYMPAIIESEEYKFQNDAELAAEMEEQSIPRTQPTYHQYYDAVAAINRSMTSHQFIHFDIDQHESYDSVILKLEQVRTVLLPQLLQSQPTAMFLLTYPIYGRNYPDELVSAALSAGHNSVLHSYYFPRTTATMFDTDVAGTGVCIVNPPLYYEQYLRSAEQYMDLMVEGAQHVHPVHGMANQHPVMEKLRRKYYPNEQDTDLYEQIRDELKDLYYRPSRPSVTYLTQKDTSYDETDPDRFQSRFYIPNFDPIGAGSLARFRERNAAAQRGRRRPLDYNDSTEEEWLSQLGQQPNWRWLRDALPHIPGVKRLTKEQIARNTERRRQAEQDEMQQIMRKRQAAQAAKQTQTSKINL